LFLPGCNYRIFSGGGVWVLAQGYVPEMTGKLMFTSRWEDVDWFDTNQHYDMGISSKPDHWLNIINTNSVIAISYLVVQESLCLILYTIVQLKYVNLITDMLC
jgi:hypothetical protein